MRYTGKDFYLSFAGTVLSADWLAFDLVRTVTLVDVTTLGDTDRRQVAGVQDGYWRVKLFDAGGTAPVAAVVSPGAAGTLIFGPEGNAAGKPQFAFEALVTEVHQPYTAEDAVVYEFAGIKNGPMLADYGDTF